MSRRVIINLKALKYLSELPEKCQRLIKDRRSALADDPLPGQSGDRELLHLQFHLYRMHVGRSFTAFYQLPDSEESVRILEITTAEKVHKLYRHFDR